MIKEILRKWLGIEDLNQQITEISTAIGLISTEISTELTERERNVISILLDGEFHSVSEIGKKLDVKPSTVRYYFMQLKKKNFIFKNRKIGKQKVYALTQQKISTLLQRKINRS